MNHHISHLKSLDMAIYLWIHILLLTYLIYGVHYIMMHLIIHILNILIRTNKEHEWYLQCLDNVMWYQESSSKMSKMTVSQETNMDCLTVPGQPSQPRRPRRMSPRQNSLPARPSRGSSPSSASRSHGSLRGSFRRPDKQGETSSSQPHILTPSHPHTLTLQQYF